MKPIACAVLAAAALLLPACHNEAQDAEDRYNIVSTTRSLGELCAQARQVRDAWLAAKDAGRYRQWSLTAELDCLKADQNGGDLPADDAARDRATAAVDNLEAAAANAR